MVFKQPKPCSLCRAPEDVALIHRRSVASMGKVLEYLEYFATGDLCKDVRQAVILLRIQKDKQKAMTYVNSIKAHRHLLGSFHFRSLYTELASEIPPSSTLAACSSPATEIPLKCENEIPNEVPLLVEKCENEIPNEVPLLVEKCENEIPNEVSLLVEKCENEIPNEVPLLVEKCENEIPNEVPLLVEKCENEIPLLVVKCENEIPLPRLFDKLTGTMLCKMPSNTFMGLIDNYKHE